MTSTNIALMNVIDQTSTCELNFFLCSSLGADCPPATMVSPEVLQYISEMFNSLITDILCAAWFGVSLPLFLALFYFSDEQLRRKPIFIANAISITLGLVLAMLNIVVLSDAIRHPNQPFNKAGFLFYASFFVMLPLFIESVLIFRLVAVYPPSRISKKQAFAIYVPLAILKTTRLINEIVFIVNFVHDSRDVVAAKDLSGIAARRVEPKIEWIIQVIDNSYASLLFLWKLHQVQSLSRRVQGTGHKLYHQKFGTLFWLAVSNFVFPIIFTTAQLVCMFNLHAAQEFEGTTLNLLICNAYVEIIGVLFATIWAATASEDDRDDREMTLKSITFSSTPSQDPYVATILRGGPKRLGNTTDMSDTSLEKRSSQTMTVEGGVPSASQLIYVQDLKQEGIARVV